MKICPTLRPYLARHATAVAGQSPPQGDSPLTLTLARLLGDLVGFDARGPGARRGLIAIGLGRYVVESAVLHLLCCVPEVGHQGTLTRPR